MIEYIENLNRKYTYGDLLNQLKSLSDKQLCQTVQASSPEMKEPNKLLPVLGLATAKEWQIDTRNNDDNKHHEEHLILLTDWHTFGKDGVMAHELVNEYESVPIYPKNLKWSGDG